MIAQNLCITEYWKPIGIELLMVKTASLQVNVNFLQKDHFYTKTFARYVGV